MNELVQQVADTVGIDMSTAEKAVGMMLGFLRDEGDGEAVEAMIAATPGAAELADAHGTDNGGAGGGIMGLGQQLMGAGLAMGEITELARETMKLARQHAGDDVVDRVIASVPGLGQFV